MLLLFLGYARNAECRVKCRVLSAECRVECRMQNAECRIKCKMQSCCAPLPPSMREVDSPKAKTEGVSLKRRTDLRHSPSQLR